jgi:DNA-binding CsgD family transcriptional regulator
MAIRSKRRSTRWSAEEEAELQALVAANISRARIAVRLQRSTTAIETKLLQIARQRQEEASDGDDDTVAGQGG